MLWLLLSLVSLQTSRVPILKSVVYILNFPTKKWSNQWLQVTNFSKKQQKLDLKQPKEHGDTVTHTQQAIYKVPTAGWLQIFALAGAIEAKNVAFPTNYGDSTRAMDVFFCGKTYV